METLDSWTLPGERVLAAWCPRCRCWRLPGKIGRGPDRGAAAVHCLGRNGMYRLRVIGDAPPEIALNVARTKQRGPDAVLTGYAIARSI